MTKLQVTCDYCGYEWSTTSKQIFVTCASCQKKTPNKNLIVRDDSE